MKSRRATLRRTRKVEGSFLGGLAGGVEVADGLLPPFESHSHKGKNKGIFDLKGNTLTEIASSERYRSWYTFRPIGETTSHDQIIF